MLYAHNRYALLLIFQAMDAAGKDGAIKHVMSGVNPQGCQVFSFKHPSAQELEHDFLWRTTRCLPERGRIGIFNRSYYEEVLIVRVHPEILRSQGLPDEVANDEDIWKHRYRSIVDLEKHLHRNGTRIIKFFLHLSKEEQRQRFLARIDDPDKNWKFSQADIEERKLWKRLPARLRGLPERHQHQARAVVCRSRRRQGERPADHLAGDPRHVGVAENELSRIEQGAPRGTANDPQTAGEMTRKRHEAHRCQRRVSHRWEEGVRPTKTNDQLEPTVFAIFGGAGDLAWRKLVPALFDLSQDRSLPLRFSIIAVDRLEAQRRQTAPAPPRRGQEVLTPGKRES